MHGVIAAGSEFTARAGAEILDAGGNAVDAAVAACFATSAGEPALTSLAGGGVLLCRDGASGEVHCCDFFANAPGLGGQRPDALDFFDVELDFGPARQRFHVGAGAAAVPGVIPGLCTALERWGTLSLGEVVAPACRFLRDGVRVGPYQESVGRLVAPIWLLTERGRRIAAPGGDLRQAGECFRLPEVAEVLETLARGDWREVYRTVIGGMLLERFGPARGGLLGAEDLDAYEVEVRRPLAFAYRGAQVYTNPPPAAGGELVGLMLELLGGVDLAGVRHGSREHLRILCAAMQVADEARGRQDGVGTEARREWRERFRELLSQSPGAGPEQPAGPSSTTHISVIDQAGNAVAVTMSHGEGCGLFIGETGIMMNNLLGEEDLFPGGFHCWAPGQRISTMMSPTLLLDAAGGVTALGTGGANRIRTAITQLLSGLVDYGAPPERAVRLPRFHYESGILNAETFAMDDGGRFLDHLGVREVIRFDHPALFFGGVHVARRAADGTLTGAGDPRRGGVCLVV